MNQDNTSQSTADQTLILDPKEIELKAVEKMAGELNMPFLQEVPKIDDGILQIISQDVASENKIIAFERSNSNVKIAIVDPQNINALNILRFIAEKKKLEFDLYLVSAEMFREMSEQYSGGAEKAIEEAMESMQDEDGLVGDEVYDNGEEEKSPIDNMQNAPVTKLLSVIIKHAIEGKASDIHIEPLGKEYRVRFRVDGILHSSLAIPKGVGRAIVSRIKILSNLKIDEKRKPQDGRFKVVESGRRVDFRVSTLPITEGEKIVLRILDTGNKVIDLKSMGLMGRGNDILVKNIMEPFGIILMTGPTGSGKSTTLYACLDILNKEERNIITLEDPVEYTIAGINQSQINPEIGYTFASGLRSILRQDPNVIMVGEIRDSETAELTIHAALTGHLVLSTLHTNSSIGAIPRLVDMGIESFLLASSLRVVGAQRLVRRICNECKEEVTIQPRVMEFIKSQIENIPAVEIKKYELDLSDGIHMFQGKGCDECSNTGYRGRIAIFEALEVDDGLKEIISERNGNEVDIQKYAEKQGMITIKQDGILKVLRGFTTLSEVERVTEGSKSVGGAVEDD
ncbi:MAG: Type IV pilus assembly protein PilB [Candidatus Moranbacteria bacterium GW2011_GWC2_37_8]|nr:MAG: Type IV pilus assembly protein PilB [Candidatus Moranbacteria bacterium GW2011_GWC2_37_8]KKQ62497.1 MAG: Type IV pilus assembly protein PilB [Parcubacteria group bacterium GW2011_GWC1_38_22]KKQ81075.1 MAG: Type IV pilus assembly protein PilB [Candidatus Moranbacteria bacterium GW2011_GWD2_38_7]